MSYWYRRSLSALLAIAGLGVPLRSQSTEIGYLRGELRSDSRKYFDGLLVDMVEVTARSQAYQADVGLDGTFVLRSVAPGGYLFHVTDVRGRVLSQQYITVNPHMTELEVRLVESDRPSAPGTVSLTQLQHPPSKKAVRAFTAAARFSSEGKVDRAVEELQKAISISPEFADAYTNLAVQHIRQRRFQQAAEECERAIRIAGPDPMKLCNLAFAQLQLHRLDDAARSARAALRMDSDYPRAHLLLGNILAADPGSRAEAVQHLERAVRTFPSARATLERLRAE